MERIGKLLISRIRLPIFLLFIAGAPLLTTAIVSQRLDHYADLQTRFAIALRKAKQSMEAKQRKEKFLHRYTRPDPYFLDFHVESRHFLQREAAQITDWLNHPAVASKQLFLDRLHFLQSDQNRLSFLEEEIQLSDSCKETIERQRFPVQVNNRDLESLLALIEDYPSSRLEIPVPRPQLIITEFTLRKIQAPLQNEVFEISMDLLKREFL
jgi:hypothetical protein